MANPSIKSYSYGVRLRHQVDIFVKGRSTDPSVLFVYLLDPFGQQTGPFIPTRRGVGKYEYQKSYTDPGGPSAIAGLWAISWRGQGFAEGAVVRQHYIKQDGFVA
jgi:hypothetical protein